MWVRFSRICWLGMLCAIVGASQGTDVARPVTVTSKDALVPGEPFVIICPIEGEIDDGVAVVVERAVAEAEGAEAIVFIIDTPGGRVDSAIDITSSIMRAPCKTIAYIQGMGAISAGALISYSCDSIIMAPGTNIGASTPIMMGAEASEAVNEKSMSFVRAKYRALGEEKGHNPLIGEGMVDNEIELYGEPVEGGGYRVYKVRDGKIVDAYTSGAFTPPAEEESLEAMPRAPKGLDHVHAQIDPENVPAPLKEFFGIPIEKEEDLPEAEEDPEPFTRDVPSDVPESAELISAAGKLVTLTSSEARDFGLVPVLASSLEEVASYEGWPEVQRYKVLPNFTESLFAWLTSPLISGLLLMCGVGGLYLEVRTPGFGLPGIIGLFCLAILFGSNLVLGLAEWWDLAFITLGIILLMIELFYIPGFGIVGLGGIISLCVGLYLSFTRVPIPEYTWDYQRLSDAGQTMTVATVLFSVFVVVTWRYLPRTPMARWLVLADSQTEDAGYIVQTTEDESAVGLRGHATSYLRPAGRGRFEGKTYDVVTRGEFLEAGTPIQIIRVEGNRYVVTELKESS